MIQTNNKSLHFIGLGVAWAVFLLALISNSMRPLHSLRGTEKKQYSHEVYGFLPYWNINHSENIDFKTLTTLAYFDVKIEADGSINRNDAGYQNFISDEATEIFKKAHTNGTQVVLTITLMNNEKIKAFLDSDEAQKRAVQEFVSLVKKRGIDGINIDFEYEGDPGDEYRNKFTLLAKNLTDHMHRHVESSQVTVSVYASGVRYPKVQNIAEVAEVVDGMFMMGYDFAVVSSQVAMPTAPLNGFKEGKYWYDISTAVEDFIAVMPAKKLILGTPWYGLNFEVYEPGFKAETVYSNYYGPQGELQTYGNVRQSVTPARADITAFKTGWDKLGQVGWQAYYRPATGTWRMVFMDDTRSLGAKYDLAKQKNLLGVGIWALGFEGNDRAMWDLIRQKFGNKIADIRISQKPIYELL